MATSPAPSAITTLVDLGFYPLLAIYMFPYLKDPEMKVERVFFAYFAIFFAGNLLVHLDAHGILPGHSRKGILLGLYTMVIVVIFMGGRVIPFFTESTPRKPNRKPGSPWNDSATFPRAFLPRKSFMKTHYKRPHRIWRGPHSPHPALGWQGGVRRIHHLGVAHRIFLARHRATWQGLHLWAPSPPPLLHAFTGAQHRDLA